MTDSTSHAVRAAARDDVPRLVALMADFYGEAGFPLPTTAAAHAFGSLLDDPRLGRVWILEADGEAAGFIVLTVAFSMEFGGLRGFVDDLFVRPRFRGRGLAAAGLAEARRTALEMGARALCVEAGAENGPARRVYERAGFVDGERLLLTLPLAAAVHER
ncbi:MAG: GNAT family N-acetyltransferase [Gemmatimonadetes bacterium]|nr:GNAT family N-acetyltransferase [Gemmatimonadota bacterium]